MKSELNASTRSHAAAMILFVAAATVAVAQGTRRTSEDFFALARNFYGTNEVRQPLPSGTPGGLDCLLQAAESNHAPSLYNLTIGYRYAYFGAQNLQQAARYRARWLEALATPVSYFQLGLGQLGCWIEDEDPEPGGAGHPHNPTPQSPAYRSPAHEFIFTGARARENRQKVISLPYYDAPPDDPNTYSRNLSAAALSFTKAVVIALENWQAASPADRDGAQESLSLLMRLTSAEPISSQHRIAGASKNADAFVIQAKVDPPPLFVRAVLATPGTDVKLSPAMLRWAARLTKQMTEAEFLSAFSPTR